MKKIFEILTIAAVLIFSRFSPVAAGDLDIILNDLPQYQNKTNFSVFYTAIEINQAPVKVSLYIQKDGKDWRQTAMRDKTDYAGEFQLEGSDIYDGEGKYNFYAGAQSGSQSINSNTISTTLDMTPPADVSDYHKERVSSSNYRLYFKCPSDTDFEKVYIYRSKETSFTADSDTRVTEIGCAPGESKTTEVGGDNDADYYFALRALDHAGNVSGVTTDAPGTVIAGQVAGAAIGQTSGTGTKEKVVLLPEETTAIPTEATKGGELGGGGATKGEVKGESTPKSKTPYLLGGFGLILVAGAFYFLRKKEA